MFTNSVLAILTILLLVVYWLDRKVRRMSTDAPNPMADLNRTIIPETSHDPRPAQATTFLVSQRAQMASIFASQLARCHTAEERADTRSEEQEAWRDVVRTAELQFGERATRTALLEAGFDSPR